MGVHAKAGLSSQAPKCSEGTGHHEQEIYTRRFSPAEEATRKVTWEVLCRDFFQQFISPSDVVVDIGAGDGHFLKNIQAARRIAVDLSPHVGILREVGVEVFQVPAGEFGSHFRDKADVVFMSNFLEHLPSKSVLLEVLGECFRVLKSGGSLLILQPNIRYVGPAYWDYIDHHIALTENSLVEALLISGYKITKVIPRFLPYTAKSKIGHLVRSDRMAWLVKWYLRLPLLWKFFGGQTFVVAQKPMP